jgi:hypothetical protein
MSLTIDTATTGFIPIATFGKRTLGVVDRVVPDGVISYFTNEKEPFRLAVNKDIERQVIYVTAPSGSGKSYFTKQYIEDYHKAYPKRMVFMFSSLLSDTTLDKLKYLKRMKIKEEKFLNTELTAQDFKESLCIFDDIDVIADKVVKKKVYQILNSLLQIGRHERVSVVFTSHLATCGQDTKIILAEAHNIVVFPRNAGARSLKYLLYEYLGFSKQQIKQLRNCSGRWVCIARTTYPMSFFSHTEAFIKQNEDI